MLILAVHLVEGGVELGGGGAGACGGGTHKYFMIDLYKRMFLDLYLSV